jgi:sulfite reductase alpha subunit-like flavoprotein
MLFRAPHFRLPDDISVPIVMVAAGTGIAPFRALWQERQFRIRNNSTTVVGHVALYFGCRSSMDELYSDEIKIMISESVINAYYVAYSRCSSQKKTYVQDLMVGNSSEIFDLLFHKNAHIYVCGDSIMASDVTHSLETIVSIQGALMMDEAKQFISRLKV